ncbi:MAG TPA: T9SS type A sorting domain-containing protein [Agriterribacter sp.]|nr:T9SS type A sorting domain-containing protein [Agriterribacter sp.]
MYGYSLYEFQVFGLNAILPIVLADFNAVKKDGGVQLTWDASMDAESRFNIQRSGNGADFTTIGTLYFPTGTNGISNHYSYTDEAPLAGVNYYRLEYTETGEKTLYSDIRTVRLAEKRGFSVFPNPVKSHMIYVELDKAVQSQLTLRLLTSTGKVINQQQVNAGSQAIQLKLNKYISPGTYILQVLEGNQPVRSRQIVINR